MKGKIIVECAKEEFGERILESNLVVRGRKGFLDKATKEESMEKDKKFILIKSGIENLKLKC